MPLMKGMVQKTASEAGSEGVLREAGDKVTFGLKQEGITRTHGMWVSYGMGLRPRKATPGLFADTVQTLGSSPSSNTLCLGDLGRVT